MVIGVGDFREGKTVGAIISGCGKYRWVLWRTWDKSLPVLGFGMLNPSTADATISDPTVTRNCERARRLGFGGIIVWNLNAFRATDPKVMKAAGVESVGPENDDWMWRCLDLCQMTICGWGKDGKHGTRSARVRKLLKHSPYTVHYLKMSEATGEPWHPLYVGYDVQPVKWEL